ncbi:MAG: TatD family hydrolase [Coriobacteriales bacterium]|jgi:TatD DNase family protein|nr:TatD family hydrolase [Coriobacteriales bacterium]
MRTVTDAASNVANQDQPPEVFWDALFRDSKDRVVAAPALPAPVADTHCHLDMLHYPELALARAAAHGVDFIVTVVDPTEDPAYTYDNLKAWQTASEQIVAQLPAPQLRVLIGCHPHNASRYDAAIEAEMLARLGDTRSAGIGEIGLDYHYDHSPRDVQREVFARQLQLAVEQNLPVALHLREAHHDGLAILREAGTPAAGTLLHCFNLDFATLEPFLELGCMVAFGGPLTFKKSEEVRQAARLTPPERIVTETDAPFMAPHPVRGVICGPEHTVYTAARLLEAFGHPDPTSPQAALLLQQFHENARAFFS